MSGISVEVKGVDKLNKNLDSYDKKTERKVIASLDFHGLMIESDAKKKVAVDTGRLRNSIHMEKSEKFERKIGTNVEYAPYVEYGTSKMSGRPYLFPALERNRKKFINALKKILNERP